MTGAANCGKYLSHKPILSLPAWWLGSVSIFQKKNGRVLSTSSILCQLAMASKRHDQAKLRLTATRSEVWGKQKFQRLCCGCGALPGVLLLGLLSQTCPEEPGTTVNQHEHVHLPGERCPHTTWNRGNRRHFLGAAEQVNSNTNETGWSTYWNPATYAVTCILSMNCNKPLKMPFHKKKWSKWTCPWVFLRF